MSRTDFFLECTRCGETLTTGEPRTVCPKDGGVLFVRYDLKALKNSWRKESLKDRPRNMWRYLEVLPPATPVTLGEGWTPLLPSRRHPNVFIKEEGANPTGSFKARGLSSAVTMARHYGLRKLAIPSAGNAGGALAAYAAAAGIEANVFMPRDVPRANLIECKAFGAKVTLVDGLIGDCARLIAEKKQQEGWFEISTLKEPYRVEGKKTMGYEVAEQMDWRLPDAIFYPTGGGVGLIGMWKAFAEMETLGWIGSKRPRMVAVQAAGCAPIVAAHGAGHSVAETWPEARTLASGLRVPKAYGDYLLLDILRQSRGTAVAVTDDEMVDAVLEWSRDEGIFAAPEGAATLAAYRKLLESGFLKPAESAVLFNTGTGMKYLDVLGPAVGVAMNAPQRPAPRRIGGIIGPY